VALWHGQARLSIAGLELFQVMAQIAAPSPLTASRDQAAQEVEPVRQTAAGAPLTRGPIAPMTDRMPRLSIYQPDIPQNTGTMLRLAACLGVPVEIIEPAAFDVSDRNLRRSGMDYLNHVTITRHISWRSFETWRREAGGRLILATTKGAIPYADFAYEAHDIILVGRESAGVPDEVHQIADARVLIPMQEGMRSLNVAVTAAMFLGEALRQTRSFPTSVPSQI
jgi:tRNA (cytidine/uridine-2'-O-)-methyltransferase